MTVSACGSEAAETTAGKKKGRKKQIMGGIKMIGGRRVVTIRKKRAGKSIGGKLYLHQNTREGK